METSNTFSSDLWAPMTGFTGIGAYRRGRFLTAQWETPHRCYSTSSVNGGERLDLTHVMNHQSCEGTGHQGRDGVLHSADPNEYHQMACEEAGLPPASTALLGTAAGMHYAACGRETNQDDEVAVWATGGVTGNAGRAGDPAQWREGNSGWEKTGDPIPKAYRGTINLMAFFNQPLSPGGMARAVSLMTEAKSSVLQELGVVSRASRGLATGTGTDQFALVAPLASDSASSIRERTWPGHHSKLGQILATATQKALRETLRWQNGLEPSLARAIPSTCRRFGLEREVMEKFLDEGPDEKARQLFKNHREALFHHPAVSAGASLFAELEDRLTYGMSECGTTEPRYFLIRSG
jgi:adenosylcobinamide amidohydrolase